VVTGATGCLGFNLTHRLLKDGHEVIALGRNKKMGHKLNQLGAKFISLDLNDFQSLKTICHNVDTIFHCAALSSPWGRYENFYETNVLGTKHIVNATPCHARLIHVSTPSIYFDFSERHDIKEGDILPEEPANAYVKTKRLAEAIVDDAYIQNRIDAVTIRPRGIFGPFDRALFPRLLHAGQKGVLPVIGDGNNLIDITFVDNVVESMLLAAKADSAISGKKYNITNDEPRTVLDLLSTLFKIMDRPLKTKHVSYKKALYIAKILEIIYRCLHLKSEPKLTAYSVGVLALGQTLNIEEAKKDLGYQPLYSINEGLQRFSEWYAAYEN